MNTKRFVRWLRRSWPMPTGHDRRALELFKSLFLISLLLTGVLRQLQIEHFYQATQYLSLEQGGPLAPLVTWVQADLRRFSGFHLLYCALALAAMFRIWTRALLVSLFLAHALLVRAFEGLANQSEVSAPYFLVFLLFVDFRSRRASSSPKTDRAELRVRYLRNLLALRGLQVQLALFYFFNGFTKAMHAEWLRGHAIGDVVFMEWVMTSDLRWLADYPLLYVPMTYSVLAYELLFPIWVFFSKTRGYAVAYGLLLHTFIAAAMNQLVGLSLMTIAALFLFCHPSFLRQRFLAVLADGHRVS